MQKKFYATPSLGFTGVLCFGVGALLMSVPLLVDGLWMKWFFFAFVAGFILLLFWFASTRGTYITVNDNQVKGKAFFIPGKSNAIDRIVSLRTRDTFGGLITQIEMSYRNRDNKTENRGLTSKEMLKKGELKELVELLKAKNQNIEISSNILN